MPKERGFRRSSLDRRLGCSEMLQHFRDSRLVATYCVGFCVLFTFSTIFTFVGFHLAAPPYELSTAAIGSLFVTYLAGVVTTPLVGRGVARWAAGAWCCSRSPVWAIGIALTLAAQHRRDRRRPDAGRRFRLRLPGGVDELRRVDGAAGRSSAVGLYVTFYYLGGSVGGIVAGLAWILGGWPGCVACALAVLGAVALVVRATGRACVRVYMDGETVRIAFLLVPS